MSVPTALKALSVSVQTALKLPLFDPFSSADGLADWDGDGLSNAEEFALGTDFLNPDTDGDGFDDGVEVFELFSDPLNPGDPAVSEPQESTVEAVPPAPTSGETSGAAPPPAAGDSAPSSGAIAVVPAVPVPLTTSGTTPSNPATPQPQTGASPTAQPPVLAPSGVIDQQLNSALSPFHRKQWTWEVQRGEVHVEHSYGTSGWGGYVNMDLNGDGDEDDEGEQNVWMGGGGSSSFAVAEQYQSTLLNLATLSDSATFTESDAAGGYTGFEQSPCDQAKQWAAEQYMGITSNLGEWHDRGHGSAISNSANADIGSASTERVRIKLKEPLPEDSAPFLVTALRVKKKDGDVAEVTTHPFVVQPGQQRSELEVELHPLWEQGAVHEVGLLQVEVNSMDRYLAGSLPQSTIDALGGDSKFGLVFRNTASGEEYRFNKISEAHVYDNPLMSSPNEEDKFLSNNEIAAWANGPNSSTKELTQEVVFYRQDGNLHFRGLFDEAGQIEIGLLKDSTEVGKITHTLTRDADIGSLLENVDSILAGTWDDPGGIILAAMQQGVSGDDLEALRNAANQAAAASFGDQSDAGGFTGFLRRNLTIKVNIPTWKAVNDKFVNGVRKAGEATARAIKVVAFTGKGFVEGAWMGVKDDAISLVELGKMIINPAETAKTFYEGFKVLIDLDMEGWKNVGKTLVKSFLEKGDEGVGEWAEPNNLDVAAYLVGFTAGFITEQIVVTYVTAGIVKAGNIGAKMGQFLRRAARGLATALEGAAQAVRTLMMKSKNSLFRRFSQDALSAEDVKALKRVLQELELACQL